MAELGIDLAKRKNDVDCIVLKFFRRRIRRNGWAEEDALAEVYLALAIRNKGKCPFDERKSSFGHYVYMVADQTLTRMFEKARMQRLAKDRAHLERKKASERPTPEAEVSAESDIIRSLTEQGKEVEAEVAWYLARGCTLVDVAVYTGWRYERVKAAARMVREEAEAWLEN